MGIVREVLLVKGEKKEERLSVLFDSGSARSLIKSKTAEEFTSPRELLAPIEVTVANGHKINCKFYARGKRPGFFVAYLLIPEDKLNELLKQEWVKGPPDPAPGLAEELQVSENFMKKKLKFKETLENKGYGHQN